VTNGPAAKAESVGYLSVGCRTSGRRQEGERNGAQALVGCSIGLEESLDRPAELRVGCLENSEPLRLTRGLQLHHLIEDGPNLAPALRVHAVALRLWVRRAVRARAMREPSAVPV
jgi:hypothetical protein